MLLVSQRLDSPLMDPLLSGSLKRKFTGAVEGSASLNGVSDTSMIQGGAKRLCLEDVTLAMCPSYPQPTFPSGICSQGGVLEGNRLNSNNNSLGSPYSVPPTASPGSTSGGGGGSGGLTNNFNPNGSSATPSVEQELQEILDELTNNPDPSLPELDIEKILGKENDDQASSTGGFVHPDGNGTPKRSPQRQSHLEAHLTQSPGFSQAGSSQVGPSPAGAPYTLPHPSKPVPSPLSASPLSSSSSQGQNKARSPMLSAALSSRPGSSWHEVNRAQQLQQMASNSKHYSKNSVGQPHAQSGLSGLGQQGTSWAGPSPPYRPGDKLPNSSPHQQPFSPAGNIQSPQSSLISSMAPAPSTGPSPPYRPEKLASPAIAQPPFSPQNSLLSGNAPSGGSVTTIQGSQASYLPGVAPTSSSTRPSPPYRTDKHPNPTGQCQPGTQPPTQGHLFNSQNNQVSGMSSQLFKAITSTQPPNNLLMQARTAQGKPSQLQLSKTNTGGMGPEPYSFNNTKPLRHFDPDPSVTKLGPLGVGGYRSASMQSSSPTSATGHAHLLPQRMQRGMQAGGLMPHCRDDQGAGMMSHLQESPSAVPRQPQGNNYNLILKNQLLNKQLQQQEKQRQMEHMNGGQITDCQQVVPFQGPGRPLPSECGGYAMGPSQQPNSNTLSLSGPLPTNRMGLSSGSMSQIGPNVGGYMCSKGSKQPLCHPSQDFGMAMQPGQIITGMGGPPRQPLHPAHGVTRPGMPCPNITRGPVPTHHLRQALHQGGALTSRMMFPSQQQPSSQSQLWQHQQGMQPHMDPATLQHPFPSGGAPPGCGGSQFPQRSTMAGMPANFPVARPTLNQVAPGLIGRQDQKMPTGQPLPSISQQNFRIRGPLSALAVMKPGGPSMMHPAHGMAPPSYQTASAGKHCPPQGYSPGHKLPSFDYTQQHQSNGGMGLQRPGGGGAGGEVDFIDTLVGSNEDWLNNLTMIDEYLEQNS
ncbi:mastermind-like domain-containing protein 1 isoform X2 [Xyrauchen texanus]|uniref:mastermind-like domain-containing protein 1 isoform X2 n=1 Tax=Xyrauchen texanus TaxID=154827 RepID=UPI00224220FD|nr:mastermind-like domain-containing protein 1 isoform X2 [Xyrauchen texanus]